MKKLSLLSLAVLLGLSACSQQVEQSATASTANEVDHNIKPQEDFYRFVNGKWLESAKIPSDRTSWGTLAELNDLNDKRSLALLKDVISDPKYADDPRAKRIKALYETFEDVKTRNALGVSPIKADLAKIDKIQHFHQLVQYFIDETKQGNTALFGWSVFAHLKNSRQNAVYLSVDSLGLSRSYYQKPSPENEKTLADYQQYIAKILRYANVTNPQARAKAIVAYEKEIAKTLFTDEETRDMQKRFNLVSSEELATLSKRFNLAHYLKAVGVDTAEVILWEPNYFKQFDRLISPENLTVIKDYLRFKLISESAPYLNDELDQLRFDFYGRKLTGQQQLRSIDKRGMSLVNGKIGEDFAQFYVAKFFPANAKEKLLDIAGYLVKAYQQRLDKLGWMSYETKQKARVKLDKFTTEIGYPNQWKDYSSLQLKSPAEGGSLYENLRMIAKWDYQDSLSQVGKPVNINEWGMLPQVVNAAYIPTLNRVIFPAGILQAPLYDLNAEPAANFGAIGAIIGHEITHGFDDSGSKVDGDGNLVNWWTETDRMKFKALSNRLAEQFNQFEVAPNVHVNGHFTLGENIADLGGLSIAYDAFKLYQKDHGQGKTIDGFTPEQRFFMSWTRSWRAKATVQALTHQVKSDPHAPAQFRAFAPILNIGGFHQAFKTKQGDRMFRSERDRLRIW